MVWSIIIDGRETGRLRSRQEGLMTVFEAECALREGVTRLSVYGGGNEGYLGVMTPGKDRLFLRRRLTRAELSKFPKKIEYAGLSGMKPQKSETPVTAKAETKKPDSEAGDTWITHPDGTLTLRNGLHNYIAIPVKLRRSDARIDSHLRTIDGREYLIFKY